MTFKPTLLGTDNALRTGAPQALSVENNLINNPLESELEISSVEINDKKSKISTRKNIREQVKTLRSNRLSISSTASSPKNKVSLSQSNVERSEVIRTIKENFDQKQSSGNVLDIERFSEKTYENYSNVSQEKPEIILMTDFIPIFEKDTNSVDKFKTNSGYFFDYQNDIKKIKELNIKKIVDFNSKKSNSFKNHIIRRERIFSDAFNTLFYSVLSMSNILNQAEKTKKKLDVASHYHDLNWEKTFKEHLSTFGSDEDSVFLRAIPEEMFSYIPFKTNIIETLEVLGFDTSDAKEGFTSTKLIMQLLYELATVLRFHSTQFTEKFSNEKKENSSKINRFSRQRFFPVNHSVKRASQILLLKNSETESTLSEIEKAYEKLYQNENTLNGYTKISLISNSLSKVFKFSSLLKDESVKNHFFDKYNYSTDTNGNLKFVDQIFGDVFGFSILEKSIETKNSIETIVRQKDANGNIILALEPAKFYKEEKINAIPGFEAYVESVFNVSENNFNTEDLQVFYQNLKNSLKILNETVSKMDLLFLSRFKNEDELETKHIFADPVLSFQKTFKQLFDLTTAKVKSSFADDPVIALFELANKNIKLKSLLFLFYVIPNDAIDTHNKIVNLIRAELEKIKISNNSFSRISSQSVLNTTVDEIIDSLTSYNTSDKITQKVFDLVFKYREAVEQFCTDQNGKSLYMSYQDTNLLMSYFDMIVHSISLFGNRSIFEKNKSGDAKSGQQNIRFGRSPNITSFKIRKLNTDRKRDLDFIQNKIKTDISYIQRGFLVLLNTFSNIEGEISLLLTNLKSQKSKADLFQISRYFDNKELLNLTLNENQMSLLKNQLLDFKLSLNENERFKLLKKSVLSEKERDIINSFFSLEMFLNNPSKNNLKIMTIGIPQQLMRNFGISRKMIRNNQTDNIIKILVYKINVLNPDLPYKPKEFAFEMTRFISQSEDLTKNINDFNSANTTNILRCYPTREIQSSNTLVDKEVEYILTDLSGEKEAFSEQKYSFLSKEQKIKIYENHVFSHIFEKYLNSILGLSVSENSFNIDSQNSRNINDEFMNNLIFYHLKNYFQEKLLKFDNKDISLFGSSIKKQEIYFQEENNDFIDESQDEKSLNSILTKLTNSQAKELTYHLSVISELSFCESSVSDPSVLLKKHIHPNVFDRVFTFYFDPSSFELDYEKISTNSISLATFDSLKREDKIIEIKQENSEQISYLVKEEQKNGENIVEKYFTAIEILTGENS